jgi:hypothetical protein
MVTSSIQPAEVREELGGDPLSFDGDRTFGACSAEQFRGPFSAQTQRCATRDEFPHQRVEPTRRLRPQRDEVVVRPTNNRNTVA